MQCALFSVKPVSTCLLPSENNLTLDLILKARI